MCARKYDSRLKPKVCLFKFVIKKSDVLCIIKEMLLDPVHAVITNYRKYTFYLDNMTSTQKHTIILLDI